MAVGNCGKIIFTDGHEEPIIFYKIHQTGSTIINYVEAYTKTDKYIFREFVNSYALIGMPWIVREFYKLRTSIDRMGIPYERYEIDKTVEKFVIEKKED